MDTNELIGELRALANRIYGDGDEYDAYRPIMEAADRLAAVEYRLQCANLYGHQCDADISELIKRAEKAEADLAALRAMVEAAPVGETECCDAKGAWLVMADDAKLANGQRVRLLSDPQPEGR